MNIATGTQFTNKDCTSRIMVTGKVLDHSYSVRIVDGDYVGTGSIVNAEWIAVNFVQIPSTPEAAHIEALAFEKDIEILNEVLYMYPEKSVNRILSNLVRGGWSRKHVEAVYAAHVAGRMIQHRADQRRMHESEL
jgi:hypothetical protein